MARRETVVYTLRPARRRRERRRRDGLASASTVRPTSSTPARSTGRSCSDAFAPYVGAARKAGGGARLGAAGARAQRRRRRPRSSGGSDREEVQRIREWARENGHKVSERGRLSSSVLEAYRAAQLAPRRSLAGRVRRVAADRGSGRPFRCGRTTQGNGHRRREVAPLVPPDKTEPAGTAGGPTAPSRHPTESAERG